MSDLSLRVRALRSAYKFAWAARRGLLLLPYPHLNGAMVALWCDDRVLMVRNSYNNYYSFPGGRVNMGESFRDAAARELHEETGIALDGTSMTMVHGQDIAFGWRKDRVEIFESATVNLPNVTLDPVEIAEFHWWRIDEALNQPLYRPAKRYLSTRFSKNV